MTTALTAAADLYPQASPARRSSARTRRRNAIRRLKILDSAPEAAFDEIVMLAARICETKSAAISFIDDHRQWFKATSGLALRETPIASSFCAHAIEKCTIMVVPDAGVDPRFSANPLVTGEPWIRFYGGMPILANDGTPIATLCVFDPVPRPQGLSHVEQTTLRVLARQVASLLELRRLVFDRQAQVLAQSALSKKLQHVAEHDVLTGLPHRGVFHKRLLSALCEAKQKHLRVVLMMVDVDHFKQINDSLGHDVGDALLCNFADRLQASVRRPDCVARLGGDEFGIIISGVQRDEEIDAVVRSITERLYTPITYNGRQIDCQASIGLAIYPDHAETLESLVKCSDLALAEAKRARGCIESFRPEMIDDFEQETRMLSVAREAVEGHRILPYYQPKVDLRSGSVIGFEALVRCDRADGGPPILPEMFAFAFTDRKLAVAIGHLMLASILDDMRAWADAGLAFGHIAINSCAADFSADDYAERLLSGIAARGLSPNMIELEVTEGVFLGRGAHHVKRALSVLSERGMRIALDDFGTGYASLIHLKQFPVDVLKIDRSFIAGIGKSPDDTAIVRALIGLGHSLGIETVAEGLETCAQVEFVKALGCDIGQGFFYDAAQPRSAVPEMVARFKKIGIVARTHFDP